MQNAGQFGPGAASTHPATQFVPSEQSPNGGSTTSSLRQFRKKDVDKSQVEQQQAPKQMSETHVARVAPHSHYPPVNNDVFRFTGHQFSSFSPQVKYPDLAEPSQTNPISTSVIQKPKPKDYMELCNVQQQHLNSHQQYSPDNGQYMHKEPVQGYPAGYKPESHFFAKEQHQYQQLPHHPGPPKFNAMVTQNMRKFNPAPADNPFLDKLSKIHPSMARSIISDHHLQDNQPTYPPIDQRGMYGQQNHRYYSGPPPMHQSNPYSPTHNYAPINTPHPYSNYPSPTSSCNYSRPPQMGSVPPRYSQMEQSMSPGRRACVEGMHLPHMNYHPMHQKMAMGPNYSPQYRGPEYAQHYQHRRMPQDCFPQSCRPVQFMQNHHQITGQGMQELSENTISPSDSLKKFIENWADEEPSADINPMETNMNLREKLRDDAPPGTVYMINATDVQYFENNGIPIVTSDNGGFQLTSENYQYLVKNGLVDNSGMVRIIEANKEVSIDPNGNQERVVNLQIMEATKSDCMMAGKHIRSNDGAPTQNNLITKPENDTRRVVIHQNTILQPGNVGVSDIIAQQPADQVSHSQSIVDNLGITKELVDKNCSPINLDHLEHNIGFNEPEPPETESASVENNSNSPSDPNISNDQHLNEINLADDLSQSSDSSQYKSPGSKSMPIIDFFGEAHVVHHETLGENEEEAPQSISEGSQTIEQEVTNENSNREPNKEVKVEDSDCKPELEPLASALVNDEATLPHSDGMIAIPETVKTEPLAESLENSSGEPQSKSDSKESGDAMHEASEVLPQRKRIFSVDDIIHNIGNDMKRYPTDLDDAVCDSSAIHHFIEREVEFSSFEQLDSVNICNKPVIVKAIKMETDSEAQPNITNSTASPLTVEGNCIFLKMSEVLMEIRVNTVDGKKIINVKPLSDSTIVVDHNDNYEVSSSPATACNKNMDDENGHKDTEGDSVKDSGVEAKKVGDTNRLPELELNDFESGLGDSDILNAEIKEAVDKSNPTEHYLGYSGGIIVETKETADEIEPPEHESGKGVGSEDSLENNDNAKEVIDDDDVDSERSLESNDDLSAETIETVDGNKPPGYELGKDVDAVDGDLSVGTNEITEGNIPPEPDLPQQVCSEEHYEINDNLNKSQTATEKITSHSRVNEPHIIENIELVNEVSKPESPSIQLLLPKEEIKMETMEEPTEPIVQLPESSNEINQFETPAALSQGETSNVSVENNVAGNDQNDVADNLKDLLEYDEDASFKCFELHHKETFCSQPDTVETLFEDDRNKSAEVSVISLNESDTPSSNDGKVGSASVIDSHDDDGEFEKPSDMVDLPETSAIINQPNAMEECSVGEIVTECEEKNCIIENNIASPYQDGVQQSSADLDVVKEISDDLSDNTVIEAVNEASELVQIETIPECVSEISKICVKLEPVDDNLTQEGTKIIIINRDEFPEETCEKRLHSNREEVGGPIAQLESVDEIIMPGSLVDQGDDLIDGDERVDSLEFPLEDEVFIAEPPALEFIVSDPLDLGALEVRGSPEIPLEPVTTTEEKELVPKTTQPEVQILSPTSTNIDDNVTMTKNGVYSKRKYSTDNDVSECATSTIIVTKAAKKLYESDLRVQHDIVSSSKKEVVTKPPSKTRKPGTKKSKRLNEKAQAKTEQKEVFRLLVEKRKRREELRQKERPKEKRTNICLEAGRSSVKASEHDDEYVDFKELLRARKLKKMKKLEELKTQQAENGKSDKSQHKPGNSYGPREKLDKHNDCCIGCREGAGANLKFKNDKKFDDRRVEPEPMKGSKTIMKLTHETIRTPSINDDRPSSTSNNASVENKNPAPSGVYGLHPKDPRRKPRIYTSHVMVPSVCELIKENAESGSKKKISLADYVSRKRKATCVDSGKNKTERSEEGEKRFKLDTERTVSQQGKIKMMKDVKTSFVIHSSDWEDSNSPVSTPQSSKEDRLIIYDFSGLMRNNPKKPVIDLNELTTPLENPKDRKLQEYKDKVDSQLSSLNIQIPKIKPHGLDGKGGSKSNLGPYGSPKSSSIVDRFLKNEKLSQSEMEKIRKIISYKRSIQHQKNGPSPSKSFTGVERRKSVSFVNCSPDPKYEVSNDSRVDVGQKEVRLHIKKVNAKRKLPSINDEKDSSSVISNESEAGHKKPDGYSVINRLGEDGLPKIIFKRNRESGFTKDAVVELIRLDLDNLEKVKQKYNVTVSQMMM